MPVALMNEVSARLTGLSTHSAGISEKTSPIPVLGAGAGDFSSHCPHNFSTFPFESISRVIPSRPRWHVPGAPGSSATRLPQ